MEQGNLLIVWNEPNMIGIKILDEQHRGIVSIINSLHYSLLTRDDYTLLKPTAEMIMGYTQIHFKTELELLAESAYPRLKEHQALHARLIADSNNIFQNCLEDGGDPSQFLNFLKEWWLVHITREDKAYSGHLIDYLQSSRRVITKRQG